MSDEPEIEIIKARKLLEMKKKLREDKPKTDRETMLEYLVERGEEVLATAEAQYPKETRLVVKKIAELLRSGEVQGKIPGGDLLALFRSIGLRVRMDTSIRVEKHGKLVSLSDKLRSEE